MNVKKRVHLIAIAFLSACVLQVWGPPQALATSCIGPFTVQAAVDSSDAVFFGRVAEVVRNEPPSPEALRSRGIPWYAVTVRFDVISTWKGPIQPQQAVYMDIFGSRDGPGAVVGETYLVYASKAEDGSLNWSSSPCLYWRPQEQWDREFELLGPGTPPLSQEMIAAHEHEAMERV
ncbi:MAG TPA: hypothetical protein VF826_00440, partial [Chloroflexia bacterium]